MKHSTTILSMLHSTLFIRGPRQIISSHFKHLAYNHTIIRTLFVRTRTGDTGELSGEEKQKSARKWLAAYTSNPIPNKICDVTFSRSSGPGGQNVNKYEHQV